MNDVPRFIKEKVMFAGRCHTTDRVILLSDLLELAKQQEDEAIKVKANLPPLKGQALEDFKVDWEDHWEVVADVWRGIKKASLECQKGGKVNGT